MNENDTILELQQSRFKKILSFFSIPKTPRQVEKELGIQKLKLKLFIKERLLKPLNPNARKGRLHVLTNKGRKILGLPRSYRKKDNNWDLIGWIMASPRQRLVALKVLDSIKRTSEEIRKRADRFNSHFTRISTKQILKELIEKGLVASEKIGRKKYYWIDAKGLSIINVVLNFYF
jgi:predicted transcriptional regulator